MGKLRTYLYTIAIAAVVIAAAFIVPIAPLKAFCLSCLGFAQQNLMIGAAAICAFIFLGNRNYWLIMGGCAIVTALVIQFGIIGHNAAVLTWAARIVAFMAIVYLMNFVRVLINR